MGLPVSPSYGGGFLEHIVFNALPLNRFDSNLVHLFNLSKKGHKCFLVKMDASLSCYDIIKF